MDNTHAAAVAVTRRAPCDAVDAKLETLGLELQDLCDAMADAPTLAAREAMVPRLIAATAERAALRFERDQIIRAYFSR